jgi:hypothetical protein
LKAVMEKCDEIQIELGAYLDGEVSSQQRATLESHIRDCAACQTVLADLESVRGALSDLPKLKAPQSLAASIRKHLNDAPPAIETLHAAPPVVKGANFQSSRPSWRPALTAIAALLMAAVLIFLLLPSITSERSKTASVGSNESQRRISADPIPAGSANHAPADAPVASAKPSAEATERDGASANALEAGKKAELAGAPDSVGDAKAPSAAAPAPAIVPPPAAPAPVAKANAGAQPFKQATRLDEDKSEMPAATKAPAPPAAQRPDPQVTRQQELQKSDGHPEFDRVKEAATSGPRKEVADEEDGAPNRKAQAIAGQKKELTEEKSLALKDRDDKPSASPQKPAAAAREKAKDESSVDVLESRPVEEAPKDKAAQKIGAASKQKSLQSAQEGAARADVTERSGRDGPTSPGMGGGNGAGAPGGDQGKPPTLRGGGSNATSPDSASKSKMPDVASPPAPGAATVTPGPRTTAGAAGASTDESKKDAAARAFKPEPKPFADGEELHEQENLAKTVQDRRATLQSNVIVCRADELPAMLERLKQVADESEGTLVTSASADGKRSREVSQTNDDAVSKAPLANAANEGADQAEPFKKKAEPQPNLAPARGVSQFVVLQVKANQRDAALNKIQHISSISWNNARSRFGAANGAGENNKADTSKLPSEVAAKGGRTATKEDAQQQQQQQKASDAKPSNAPESLDKSQKPESYRETTADTVSIRIEIRVIP